MIRDTLTPVLTGLEKEKFIYIFERTYIYEKFRNFLNLILTLAQFKKIKINLSDLNNFDDYLGLCQTFDAKGQIAPKQEKNALINFVDRFSKTNVVIIKKITNHVIMHEMAHALEKQLNIDLVTDFLPKIIFDIKNCNTKNIIIKNQIQQLMVDELKGYSRNHFLSELFARYFEIYAFAKEISNESSVSIFDLDKIFIKTNEWLNGFLNPLLKQYCSLDVMNYSKKRETTSIYKSKWVDKGKTFRGNLKWSDRNKSNFN